MNIARPLLLALVAAVPFAARGGAFKCPEQGGPEWREIRSQHFRLHTDLSSKKARALARELERIHEVVRHGLFRTPPEAPGVVRVVAFRSEDEFDLFAPKGAAGYYTIVDGEPTIVMPNAFGEYQRIVVAHELTHHVLGRVFARQPRWLGEGLASFMETVGQSGPGNSPTVGGVPRHRYRDAYPYHGGVREVLLAGGRLESSRQYATAWALVHFLLNRHPQEFGAFQGRLARGQDPAAAWRETFPQWDPAADGGAQALDKEIGLHLSRGKFGYRDVRLPPQPDVTEKPLGASAVHAIRLALPWINRGEAVTPGLRDAELAEALAEDPGHVGALRVQASMEPSRALALAEQTTAAHPEDPRAWLFLAKNVPEDAHDRRQAALRKAIELEPDRADALNELAWSLLGTGRSGEALPLARRAVALQPWNAAILDTLAGTLEDLGQCGDALATQRRAVDVLAEGATEESRRPYLERLARLDGACGPATAAN